MTPIFPTLLTLLLSSLPLQTLASPRHTIPIPPTLPRPAALAWDPSAQHFLLLSSSDPTISSISDAGIPATIISGDLISAASSIALDNPRRRLLVSSRIPNSLAAYDLRSPRPHRRIFSAALPAAPGGIAVDPATGSVFVAAERGGEIWRVDLEGIVSDFARSGEFGLVGVAYVGLGFLLGVERGTGRVFKVGEESGAAREVVGRKGMGEMKGIAMMADGSAVVVGGRVVRMLRGRDGWAEAAVTGEVEVGEGEEVEGVAVREGRKAYVLVTARKEKEEEEEGGELGGRIEEVEWEEEGDLVWLMVLVGFGLAYFLFWRFQMRQLVFNMNKKRA